MLKTLLHVTLIAVLAGCTAQQPTPADLLGATPAPKVLQDLPPQVRSFIDQQEKHAELLADKLGVTVDKATREYFHLARTGQYRAASQIYQDLRERGGRVESPKHDPDLRLPLWDPLLDVQLTMDAYAAGAGQYATAFGQGIVQSIPPGSIYFGGTDPGRGLAAAFCKSSADGDPFFVLTQNQLVDGQYLDYIRATFGDKINTLTAEDSQRAFEAYHEDVVRRYKHDQDFPHEPHQLRPGEDVKLVKGMPVVSGQVAVMALNGRLAKTLFDKNPGREFYVEESFPLDWMYPRLTPHGFIMKIHRQPVPELTSEIIDKDHDFWSAKVCEFLGSWLTSDTPVQHVCEFVEKVFLRKELTDFQGDAGFVGNDYAKAAYGKLRSSQGGLYAWRIANSKSPQEQERMTREADFAFRQAYALCPTSPEAIFRYVNLLVQTGRLNDALLIARTSLELKPSDNQLRTLVRELERIKKD